MRGGLTTFTVCKEAHREPSQLGKHSLVKSNWDLTRIEMCRISGKALSS